MKWFYIQYYQIPFAIHITQYFQQDVVLEWKLKLNEPS